MTALANVDTAVKGRAVTVAFRGNEVVSSVDIDVRPGEWLGLIGPNGAGKSTLLRSIAGLVEFSGTIELSDGRAPGATDLAFVPQSPILPPGMTVAEYVLLGRTAHLGWLARESRADREVASTVLHRLDLEHFARRRVDTLSGGEAQRAAIARALAQETPILLLDEPTSALDVGHQASVLELVDDLRRSDGLTVVAAMHDLTTASRFSDRLVLVDHGRLVAEGSPAEVLDPDRLTSVYDTPLTVQHIDGELVVLAAPRAHQRNPLT